MNQKFILPLVVATLIGSFCAFIWWSTPPEVEALGLWFATQANRGRKMYLTAGQLRQHGTTVAALSFCVLVLYGLAHRSKSEGEH